MRQNEIILGDCEMNAFVASSSNLPVNMIFSDVFGSCHCGLIRRGNAGSDELERLDMPSVRPILLQPDIDCKFNALVDPHSRVRESRNGETA